MEYMGILVGFWHSNHRGYIRAETIYFAYAYTKGEFEDLPPEKRRVLKQITMEIKKEFTR